MIVLLVLIQLYALLVFVRFVLGYFVLPSTGLISSIYLVVHAASEPPLSVIRSVVKPVRVGPTALDVSPVLLLVGLWLLASVLTR